jgi:hypothetical protein
MRSNTVNRIIFSAVGIILCMLWACDYRVAGPKPGDVAMVSLEGAKFTYVPRNSAESMPAEVYALARVYAQPPKINPKEIKVMTISWLPIHSEVTQNAPYMTYWDSHDRRLWEDWVEYERLFPSNEIVYEGNLERDGNYATGKVAVKYGTSNSVYVGFILPGDTLSNTIAITYYYWGVPNHFDGWHPYPSRPDTSLDTVRQRDVQQLVR